MAIHKSLPSSEVHEEKHIIDATASDAGKVVTPSSTDGVGELRKLKTSELDYGVEVSTSDSNKTLFPSDTNAGVMELRQVTFPDLDFTGFCTTSDSSKVLMPSEDNNGEMELRQVKCSEIDRSGAVRLNLIATSQDTYAVTAATDTTFNTASDYIPYPFSLNVIHNDNVTYNVGTQTFTIGANALAAQEYLSNFSCTLSSSVNTTRVGIAYKINGTLVDYRFVVRGRTADDYMPGSRHRHITLSPGDTVQLCLVCDKTCTLTQQDMSISWAVI